MNDTRSEALLKSVEDLAHETEGESARAPGWMVHVARAGVVVALLGGLLGFVGTSYDLLQHFGARANLAVVTGNSLTVSWNRKQHNLSFTRWITFRNDGEVTGVVDNPPRGRLESSPPSGTRELVEIRAEEKGGDVGFPMSVHAQDSRDVQLTMSVTVPEGDAGFLKEGTYRLYLSVDTPSTPEPAVSCLRFTKQLIDEIGQAGSVRIFTPELCDG